VIRALLICLLLSSCGESSPIGSAVAQQSFGERVSFELKQAQENNPAGITNWGAEGCTWGGSAATGNISVWFHEGHKRIRYAWWIATLIPNGGGARLVMYDSRYDLKVIGEVRSDETNPRPLGAWIQDAMNEAIVTADPGYPFKYIGVQVCGPARLYTSTIYVVTE
jgi:hypothetical protein